MTARDEALQACIDAMEREGLSAAECLRRQSDEAEELAPLLATVEKYRQAPRVAPSPSFRSAARARMLNLVAATPGVPSERPPRISPWRRGLSTPALLRLTVALAVLLLVTCGTAVVAAAALPGSPLYPAKLALEEARLMLATGNVERADLQMSMAERRAQEIAAVAGTAPPPELAHVVDLYEGAVRGAVQEAARGETAPELNVLDSRLGSQEEQLLGVQETLSSSETKKRASLGGALGFIERERTELRVRSGPGSVPPEGTIGPEESGQRIQRQPMSGAIPTASSTAPSSPEATPSSTPAPSATPAPTQGRGAGAADGEYRWGQAEATATSGSPAAVATVPLATSEPVVVDGGSTETAVSGDVDTSGSPTISDEGQVRQQGPPATEAPVPSPSAQGTALPANEATATPTQLETPTASPPTATPVPVSTPGGGPGGSGPGGPGSGGPGSGGSGNSNSGAGPTRR